MTLRPLAFLAFASLTSLAACTAIVEPPQDPASDVCGGSVCFEPQQVAVRHWGASDVTVAAWHGSKDACKVPQLAALERGVDPSGGSIIEVRLLNPKPGARLPIVSRHRMEDDTTDVAVVRAVRVDESGHASSDEDAVSEIGRAHV
jgi:hypothetical protein